MGRFHDLMDRELRIRGFAARTRTIYVTSVRKFVEHFGRSPDQLTLEHIKRYQLHLTRDRKISWSWFNVQVAAIRFFYNSVLNRQWEVRRIPFQKKARKLPEILSSQEVTALFEATQNLKHRTILMTLYAGGLRVSEGLHLRPSDIDSQRMVMRIDQGKGRKDRYTLLSPRLLLALREYWRVYRPHPWLFPNPKTNEPLHRTCIGNVIKEAKSKARIQKRVHPHSLRHAFATHLLEDGVNVRIIQKLLGHRSLRSTEIYMEVARTYLSDTRSPLDLLPDLTNVDPKKI